MNRFVGIVLGVIVIIAAVVLINRAQQPESPTADLERSLQQTEGEASGFLGEATERLQEAAGDAPETGSRMAEQATEAAGDFQQSLEQNIGGPQ